MALGRAQIGQGFQDLREILGDRLREGSLYTEPLTPLLLTGDAEPPAQSVPLSSGIDLQADVFRIPHHGSAFQHPRLLAAVDPDLAVICVGADSDHGHPPQPLSTRCEPRAS